jgi:hypothetical protein
MRGTAAVLGKSGGDALALSIGIAKLTLIVRTAGCRPGLGCDRAVDGITSPLMLTSGPLELPGLIAAWLIALKTAESAWLPKVSESRCVPAGSAR